VRLGFSHKILINVSFIISDCSTADEQKISFQITSASLIIITSPKTNRHLQLNMSSIHIICFITELEWNQFYDTIPFAS
jgi:hypothetical protein